MGKQPPKVDQNGKMKVRIIEFELEGSDMSLQESLKSITAALSRAPVVAAPRPQQRLGTTRSVAEVVMDDSGEPSDDLDQVDEIEQEEEPTISVPPAPKKQRKPPKMAAPSLVDIRFDDEKPTFAEFVEQKEPKNDMQKYLCAAFWLKTHKKVSEVSIDHMYTAYKVMGWALPTNPVQPMRELAATRDKRFSKGAEKGHYAINHVGEGFVTTKMGNGQ
ncbi:hypothetical protein [Burkholderia sp. Ac-20353]|uniref:hypothetical protein n=1 Tax=Burkholderia sp. Ac-20353 TaxID=2703894 RepID=UPI00197BE4BF|nr:hypothetical protein [Burkholderia sp. Ac-20353]MBN3791800.1 hypothetical protein [Burkholderia sp. Ac-20353]